MKPAEAIRYRGMKLLANASKILLHGHLLLFPNTRRDIPLHEPARKPKKGEVRIPRIIWQTNHSRRVSLQLYTCFRFNRLLSPTCEYRYSGDEECLRFVEENYPGRIASSYKRLTIGAARADFWRILVLLKHGGIYLDIDANFTMDPERFLREDNDGVFIAMKNGEITNYFLASAPGNPVLKDVVERIVRNIEEGVLTSVYDMTGPTVLDAAVRAAGVPWISFKQACVQGQFTNKAGQYVDKPNGAWHVEQKLKPILEPTRSE